MSSLAGQTARKRAALSSTRSLGGRAFRYVSPALRAPPLPAQNALPPRLLAAADSSHITFT